MESSSKTPIICGNRKVGRAHKSDIVTLPKTFTDTYLGKDRRVCITMSTDGTLMIRAIKNKRKAED